MALRPLHKFPLLVGRATATSGPNECYNVSLATEQREDVPECSAGLSNGVNDSVRSHKRCTIGPEARGHLLPVGDHAGLRAQAEQKRVNNNAIKMLFSKPLNFKGSPQPPRLQDNAKAWRGAGRVFDSQTPAYEARTQTVWPRCFCNMVTGPSTTPQRQNELLFWPRFHDLSCPVISAPAPGGEAALLCLLVFCSQMCRTPGCRGSSGMSAAAVALCTAVRGSVITRGELFRIV